MSITINTTFTGTGLPLAASLASQIAAISTLKNWTQFDPAYCTMASSKVTDIACRAGTGTVFSQTTDARRATLTTAALGAFSAATFQGNDTVSDSVLDYYSATGITHAADTAFTVAAVVKPTNNTSNDLIVSRVTSSSARVLLQIAAGLGSVGLGVSSVNLAGALINDWNVIIGSWDGATLRLHMNGVDTSTAVVDSTGSADWRIGALNATAPGGFGFDGLISDVLIFSSDVLGDTTQKALLLEYFNTVYGL